MSKKIFRNNVAVFAIDMAGGMGYRDSLPWPHIPEDLKSFKKDTENTTVVMGAKTFSSMNRAGVKWGSRKLVVVTRQLDLYRTIYQEHPEIRFIAGHELVPMLESEQVYHIIGGASLLSAEDVWNTIGLVQQSLVIGVFESDTYLPPEALSYMENEFVRSKSEQLTPKHASPAVIKVTRARRNGWPKPAGRIGSTHS